MTTKQPGQASSLPEPNEALQQTQRLLAWSAYQESLREVDREVLQQFQKTIGSLRAALWLKAGIYLIQFAVVALALFWSLREAVQTGSTQPWVWLVTLGSLLLLGVLLFRNPVESLNRILVDLARIQIVLQGYSRQVNQVDAAFKQALLENRVDLKYLNQAIEHIQKVIDNNIESLLQFMEDLHS